MVHWMKTLASHYAHAKSGYPNKKLIILFDIDGTILDMRHMMCHVLKSYDAIHGTRFFDTLQLEDIHVHENQMEILLRRWVPWEDTRRSILKWYHHYRWSEQAILTAHQPFLGVMEVIQWFQSQPDTSVGLNTGRPEELRWATLRSLNQLGRSHHVRFKNDLLFMNANAWEVQVAEGKAQTITHLRDAGYRVFAMVDNEPANLDIISTVDPKKEVLLLHANTIFESETTRLPAGSVSGRIYDSKSLRGQKPSRHTVPWEGMIGKTSSIPFDTPSV